MPTVPFFMYTPKTFVRAASQHNIDVFKVFPKKMRKGRKFGSNDFNIFISK